MRGIEVVRSGNLSRGNATTGILREKAFESGNAILSRSTVAGGTVSSWHHHGSRELYGYVVSGRFVLEYGRKGAKSVELNQGDFFHISPGVVHRDVNRSRVKDVVVVNLLVGEGEPVVNLETPPS